MSEVGEGGVVISPKNRPTFDVQQECDFVTPSAPNGNGVLVGALALRKDNAVADAVEGIEQARAVRDGGGRSLVRKEAPHAEETSCGTASKLGKYTIRVLQGWNMCKGWDFCRADTLTKRGRGSIHLATTMMRTTLMQILSVFIVGLSWTDFAYGLGQTDYGCKMSVDPVAEMTSSDSFMVAMTLFASIIIGGVGVAFWIHSCRRKPFSMNDIDKVLMAGPPRMLRGDPALVPPPAIEPWSGME